MQLSTEQLSRYSNKIIKIDNSLYYFTTLTKESKLVLVNIVTGKAKDCTVAKLYGNVFYHPPSDIYIDSLSKVNGVNKYKGSKLSSGDIVRRKGTPVYPWFLLVNYKNFLYKLRFSGTSEGYYTTDDKFEYEVLNKSNITLYRL
jgi:hypothetical protein